MYMLCIYHTDVGHIPSIYRLQYFDIQTEIFFYILAKIFGYTMYMLCKYHTYIIYIPSIYRLQYFDIRT